MKLTLTIIGVTLIIGVAIGFFFMRKEETELPQQPEPLFPVSSSTPAEVGEDFIGQLEQNATVIQLENAVIVSNYALQDWYDENRGGQALLKLDASTGTWSLISMGGGAWDVHSLTELGVPNQIAGELITRSQ